MSDSSDDDFEYNYSDSDCDSPPTTTTTTTSSSGPHVDPTLDQIAHTKKCFRSSPSSQRPWVNFCTKLYNLNKQEQRAAFFSSYSSTSISTSPNKTLSQSYLMIDYDTPSLDSLTITVLDGRDTIRASVTLTVNWPDLPLSVENIGLNGITTFEEEEEGEDGQVYVQKRGKNFLVEKSDVPKELLCTWKGVVSSISSPKRKAHQTGSVFSMVYWLDDPVISIETSMGPMWVTMPLDGTVTTCVKIGESVNINTTLGSIKPVLPQPPSLGSGIKARIQSEEKAARLAKTKREEDKLKCTEKLIYPVTPPKVIWNGPRLPFKDMCRIMFLPELQNDRWNICTDLNNSLKRIFMIAMESDVVESVCEYTDAEELLISLARLSKIWDHSDCDDSLVSFGVSKDFAMSDGKGDGTSKKRGLGEDGPRTTGFAKGTGYSGGSKVEDRNIQMGDTQKANSALKELYTEFREGLPYQTLRDSVVERYCEQKLREAGDSFIELDQHADEYLVIFLWGGELWKRIKENYDSTQGKKKRKAQRSADLKGQILGVHELIRKWHCRFEQLEMDKEITSKSQSISEIPEHLTKKKILFQDLPENFLPGLKKKDSAAAGKKKTPSKKPAAATAARANASGKVADTGPENNFNIDDVMSVVSVIFNEIKDDVGEWSDEDDYAPTPMDVDDDSPSAKYKAALLPLQCATVEAFTQHVFLNEKPGLTNSKWQKRILTEFKSLKASLPLEHHGSIFCRWSETQTHLLKVLIVAPEGTPYGCGCFIFDVMVPTDYPNSPPKMKIVTTGGGRHRFNPNLYADGKVCLSLLGTWQGEPWDPKVSSLNQVFMSIYALIFVEEPWFNEPGYQGQRGTPAGDAKNKAYNAEQRYKTVEIAMVDQLKNPDPCYYEVISLHFRLKKDNVIEQIYKWAEDIGGTTNNTSMRAHGGTQTTSEGLKSLGKKMKELIK